MENTVGSNAWFCSSINPQSTEPRNLYFQPLEVVYRYRDPQLQVTKN